MMRRAATLVMFCSLAAVGCAVDGTTTNSAWMPSLREFWGSTNGGAVQLELAVLRLPPGDPFIESEVWREIDEQVIALEQRHVLDANGVRVGVASGSLPAVLRERLAGKEATIRRITIRGSQEHFLPLGLANRTLAFDVRQDGDVIQASYDDALPGLALHWSQDAMGRPILRCEPRVRHGLPSRAPKPASDRGTWTISGERPEAAYSRLAWELRLENNDALVVGTRSETPNTVGQALFTDEVNKEPRQILIVIRMLPGEGTAAAPATSPEANEPVPLVVQSLAPLRP